MRRIVARPADLDLDSPGRRDYWVALEHDTMWGAQLISLTVFVGSRAAADRGLVAFGGTHGNEYEGPVALKNLLTEIDPAAVLGRLIIVPVLNVEAFRSGTRDSAAADGVNLNRAFVEGAGRAAGLSGITHRIADFVRSAIWPKVHVVIDLHSGGQQIRYAPCASFHPIADPEPRRLTIETARDFGLPLIMVYQNRTPGLLTSEAERLGKVTIGTELGWGEAVARGGVACARLGVLSAAVRFEQMKGTIDPGLTDLRRQQRCAAIVDAACYVPAMFEGHYEEALPCGALVRRGDVIGRLHDFDRVDERGEPVEAPLDGVVVAQAWAARVRRGQFIACVGSLEPLP